MCSSNIVIKITKICLLMTLITLVSAQTSTQLNSINYVGVKPLFLKDLLMKNAANDQMHHPTAVKSSSNGGKTAANCCEIKPIEMSIKFKNCGRVNFSVNQCVGACKSSEVFIPYKQLIRTTSSACKAIEYEQVQKEVVCSSKGMDLVQNQNITVKVISKCQCSSVTTVLKTKEDDE